jgi:hypothetical protein
MTSEGNSQNISWMDLLSFHYSTFILVLIMPFLTSGLEPFRNWMKSLHPVVTREASCLYNRRRRWLASSCSSEAGQ